MIVNEPTVIIKAFSERYQILFRGHEPLDIDASSSKLVSLLPQLNQDDCDYTNEKINVSEVNASIDLLAKGQTHRLDGLTAEFYECFHSLL